MYNTLAAFVFCGLAVVIGETVSRLTKAWVPSVFVSAIALLLGYWTFLPHDLVKDSCLVPFGSSLGIFLLITHMGTMFSLKALLEQWKTVVICVSSLAGMCAIGYFVGPLFMDKTLVVAGLPPLTGGIVAATMMQTAAANAGLTLASVFAITMYCIQGFAGYPLTAICLKREGARLLSEYRAGQAAKVANPDAVEEVLKLPEDSKQGILHTPDAWNTPIFMLMKLGIIAWLAFMVGKWTGVSGAIWCLVFGVVFCRLGFLEPNLLSRANSYQIVMFALMMYVFDGLKDCSPDMLTSFIGPMIALIVMGVAGMAVAGFVVSKILRVSVWLGWANCLTALYGFPFDAFITDSMCREMAANEEEREFLMGHLFPSMIVGGFATVTITSVFIASFFVTLL